MKNALLLNLFTALLPAVLFAQDAPASLPWVFNVQGEDGDDGVDGRSYSRSSRGSGSRNGSHGGDAGRASAGQDAGRILLHVVETNPQAPDEFRLVGELVYPSGKIEKVNQWFKIGESGAIQLIARGGKGGDGGDGGNGQGGKNGADGSDATRYSWGGDGEDGGNGGDGGSGSDGADAGRGGIVGLQFSETDLHLLLLFSADVSGGRGGQAGTNGMGGSAGSGGSGGSSYSWTERIQTGSDSKGNATYTTTYHSNPGGSSGSSGRSGSSPRSSAVQGEHGADGSFKFTLVDASGNRREFLHRYDLRATYMEVRTPDADAVFEFGENFIVDEVRIQNTSPRDGGLRTPDAPTEIEIRGNDWVESVPGQRLILSRSLQPKEEHRFEDEHIQGRFREPSIDGPSDPHSAVANVQLSARQTLVDRYHPNFNIRHEIPLRFPIEVSVISGLPTLLPGNATRLRLRISNTSERELGSNSEFSRHVRFRFHLKEGNLKPEDLVFIKPDGSEHSLDSIFFEDIDNIAPGESREFELAIGIKQNASTGISGKFWLELELGHPQDPQNLRRIQIRDFELKAGALYRKTPNSQVLLVSNQSTTPAESQAIRRLIEAHGVGVDEYDLSVEDSLDFYAIRRGGKSLADDFKNGSVLFLNNNFRLPSSEQVASHVFLSPAEQQRVNLENGIHFGLIGELGFDLLEFGIPTGNLSTQTFGSFRDFRRFYQDEEMQSTEAQISVSPGFWRKPSEAHLQKQAARIQDWLNSVDPERSYVVVTQYEPREKMDERGRRRQEEGQLFIRRTSDRNFGSVVVGEFSSQAVHSPEFIFSPKYLQAIYLLLGPDTRLSILQNMVQDGRQIQHKMDQLPGDELNFEVAGELLVNSLLVDIANEQLIVRNASSLNSREVRETFELLEKISELDFQGSVDPNSREGKVLIRLLGGIEFISQSQLRWWNKVFFPWSHQFSVSWQTDRLTEKMMKSWFSKERDAYGDSRESNYRKAKNLIQEEVERLEKLREEARKRDELSGGVREASQALLLRPLVTRGIESSVEAQHRAPLIFSKDEFDSQQRLAVRRAEEQRALIEEVRAAKQNFLNPEACKVLLSVFGSL